MKSRIKEVRIITNLNQADFGSRIGVSAAAVSRWEAGERTIPETAIISICREFGINEVWLRRGEGEMKARVSREEEMAYLVGSLMKESPASLRSALVTTLLRFDPGGPEWALLERIFNDVSSAMRQEN